MITLRRCRVPVLAVTKITPRGDVELTCRSSVVSQLGRDGFVLAAAKRRAYLPGCRAMSFQIFSDTKLTLV